MQTVIGLGKAGCNIAEQFKIHPQYKVIKIDIDLKDEENVYRMKRQKDSSAYEENLEQDLVEYLKKEVVAETLFILSCGEISGASLSIMQQINDLTKLDVLYIIPRELDLMGDSKLLNNLYLGVFQEYARSGLFENLFLVDNQRVSDIIGPTPIAKYWNKINETIAHTYHMINVFERNAPILSNNQFKKTETARICTMGILSPEKGDEHLFFDLKIPRERWYYYGVPEKDLDEDLNLLDNIKNNIIKNKDHENTKKYYSVHSTKYDKLIAYCIKRSTLVQNMAL